MHEKKTNALTGQTRVALEGRLVIDVGRHGNRRGDFLRLILASSSQFTLCSVTKLWALLERQLNTQRVCTSWQRLLNWCVLHDVVTLANSFLTNASFLHISVADVSKHSTPSTSGWTRSVNHHTGENHAATRILPFEGELILQLWFERSIVLALQCE